MLDFFHIEQDTLFAKALILVVVVLIAAVVTHIVSKALRRSFERIGIPQASIIINIVRGILWFFALLLVLQPVFGVQPTAFVAALGITSLVISLGMQDMLLNIVGGVSLMVNKTIQIGDTITVGQSMGEVSDITIRNTVLKLRNGNTEIIPNSVLSKTSLTKLSDKAAIACTLDFIVSPDADPRLVEQDAQEAVFHSLGALANRELAPVVRFKNMDAYGISASITVFLSEGVSQSDALDRMSRAIMGMPWLAHASLQTSDEVSRLQEAE